MSAAMTAGVTSANGRAGRNKPTPLAEWRRERMLSQVILGLTAAVVVSGDAAHGRERTYDRLPLPSPALILRGSQPRQRRFRVARFDAVGEVAHGLGAVLHRLARRKGELHVDPEPTRAADQDPWLHLALEVLPPRLCRLRHRLCFPPRRRLLQFGRPAPLDQGAEFLLLLPRTDG